jgi:hypothetical protein
LKKPVCLHHHIFKNAGTTIDWTLQKNFGKDALLFDDITDVNAEISTEQLLQFLTRYNNARSISSHQLHPFSVPDDTGFQFLPIIFVRHPIDRAFSIYGFLKRHTARDSYTLKAQNSSLKEFIKFSLESHSNPIMRNGQTRFVIFEKSMSNVYTHKAQQTEQLGSAGNFPSDSLPARLTSIKPENAYRAHYFINQCIIAGVVERFDESLVLAEERLRSYFPQIDLSYISQNSSRDRCHSLNNRLEKARLEIGDEIMDKLVESNNLDFQLYDYVSKKLENDIKDIDNFVYKLANFKNRCLLLG